MGEKVEEFRPIPRLVTIQSHPIPFRYGSENLVPSRGALVRTNRIGRILSLNKEKILFLFELISHSWFHKNGREWKKILFQFHCLVLIINSCIMCK
jgi:hypothetical protein